MRRIAWLILLLCCLQLPTWRSFALPCSKAYTRLVEPGFEETRINVEAMKRWVDAQPEKYQEAAQLIADHLHVISRNEFERALKDGLNALLDKIPIEDEIVLIYPTESSASYLWTTRYARELIPRLAQAKLITHRHILNALQPLAANIKVHFIGIDDAAYSGDQLGDQSLIYNRSLRGLLKDESLAQDVQFKFFRVFGNENALKAAQKRLQEYEGPKARTSFHFGMLRKPLLNTAKGRLLEKELKIYGVNAGWNDTLTLPFHKLPDGVSFPGLLIMGKIQESSKVIPFIRGPKPYLGEPYRQQSYLDYPFEKDFK